MNASLCRQQCFYSSFTPPVSASVARYVVLATFMFASVWDFVRRAWMITMMGQLIRPPMRDSQQPREVQARACVRVECLSPPARIISA